MGPPESATHRVENQARRARRKAHRPRMRRCLLKGCEQRFQARRPQQRYCSEHCRKAARRWSRWRAQQRYRSTTAGKDKRNGQSQRYRERVRSRKPSHTKAIDEGARVITTNIFRADLRPARLLRAIHASTAKPLTALLLRSLPAGAGAGSTAGTALEGGAHLRQPY